MNTLQAPSGTRSYTTSLCEILQLQAIYEAVGLEPQLASKAAHADVEALRMSAELVGVASRPSAATAKGGPSFWLVLAAFAAIYLIWGSTYLAIRYAVETIPPFLMAGSRFLTAGLILYLFALVRGQTKTTLLDWKNAAIAGSLMLVIGNGGVTWAERFIPSGVAALTVALIPVWMVLFEWRRKGGSAPRWRVLFGLLLGVAGVIVLAGGVGKTLGVSSITGLLALIAASMGWAWGSLFSRGAPKPASPLMGVAMQMIAGGALLLLWAVACNEFPAFSWTHITARSFWSWIWLTAAGSLVAYTAYIWLLQVSTPARVGTYAYVNPLVAVLLGCTIGQEPFSNELLISAALIIIAVAAIVWSGRSPQKQE